MADSAGAGAGSTGVAAAADSELEAALRRILQVIFRDHPLGANQILTLAAELQRIGVHRLVEEHLERHAARSPGSPPA